MKLVHSETFAFAELSPKTGYIERCLLIFFSSTNYNTLKSDFPLLSVLMKNGKTQSNSTYSAKWQQ